MPSNIQRQIAPEVKSSEEAIVMLIRARLPSCTANSLRQSRQVCQELGTLGSRLGPKWQPNVFWPPACSMSRRHTRNRSSHSDGSLRARLNAKSYRLRPILTVKMSAGLQRHRKLLFALTARHGLYLLRSQFQAKWFWPHATVSFVESAKCCRRGNTT